MAETAGVSRSAVSRAAIEASEAEVEALLSRRFDDVKLLVIYIDGLIFGKYTMIGAIGVDTQGHKHVLGIREGATENAAVVTALLEDVVARGVNPKRKMLFVIDGSKALRAAINAVFGAEQPVQRCRAHKLRNVLGYLPKEQLAQVKSVLRAAWKLPPKEGMARIKKLAAWLDNSYPSAASSLIEGLEECFTINRLDIPRHCIVAWPPPTSSKARTPVSVSRLDALPTGRTAKWCCAGWLRPSSEQRSDSIASWDIAISGLWRRSSTPPQPPARRRRSNINPTAVPNFQLRAGHAPCAQNFITRAKCSFHVRYAETNGTDQTLAKCALELLD